MQFQCITNWVSSKTDLSQIKVGIVLITLIFLFAYPTFSGLAEGSKELTSNGGDRPFTEWTTRTNADIQRRTLIHAYVNTGENVYFGSSTHTSYSNPQDIIYRSPYGGQNGTCDVINGGTGHIDTRAKEVAGPLPNAGGYIPCTFVAAETGIYEFEFHAPVLDPVDNNPSPISVTANFPVDASTWGSVAAWDVTVRSATGTYIPGRVYANLIAMNMGRNNFNVTTIVTILTHDGYQYRVNLNGIDPFGFLFFSNTKGARDSTGDALFRSIQLEGPNPGRLPVGYSIHDPNGPDDPDTYDHTHKIFFNTPAADLPTSGQLPNGLTTWLLQEPIVPPPVENFRFEGDEANTPGRMGTYPATGSFKFEAKRTASYRIIIDLNRNGIFGDGNDRIFTGTVGIGLNIVQWDALDGNGVAVPANVYDFDTLVKTFGGEIHFPFIDAESNDNGIIVERFVDPATATEFPSPFLVYYDDRYNYTGTNTYDYSLCAGTGDFVGDNAPFPAGLPGTPSGCYGVPSDPRYALRDSAINGVISGTSINNGGAHAYTKTFGDRRIIDTWTYYPSNDFVNKGIIEVAEIDLIVTKTASPAPATRNLPITFQVTVENAGPSDVLNAPFTDIIQPYLLNPSWTCTPEAGASCTLSGTGNIADSVSIPAGSRVVYTINALVAGNAPDILVNTASVSRPPDYTEVNTSNNIATVSVPILTGTTRMVVTKDDGRTVVSTAGETVTYEIIYRNIGSVDAVNVTLRDELPAGATFISCSDNCVTGNPVVWNIGSVFVSQEGRVTLTVALPPALPPHQHINRVRLNYTDALGSNYPEEVAIDIDMVEGSPTLTSTPQGTPTPFGTPPDGGNSTPTPFGTPPDGGDSTPTPFGTPPDGGGSTPTPFGTPPFLMTPTPSFPGSAGFSKQVNPPFASPGDEVTWTITVRNIQDVVMTDLTITDRLPDLLIIRNIVSQAGSWTVNGQDISWQIPSLAVGQQVSLSITTTVT